MITGACIRGVGAITPIGADARRSAAAARAGLCGFREHPYMIDSAGEPMRVARVPWLDVEVRGVDRYAAMVLPAIEQALRCAPEGARVGLALALPPPRPGLPDDLPQAVGNRVYEHFGRTVSRVVAYDCGHAAGFLALDAATRAVANNLSVEACIVAGVDSYIEPETLEWLEDCDQLHGAGPLNNAWGFIPGEAAGALLIESSSTRPSLAPLADILGLGIGQEANLIKTESVCVGAGLTEAFRSALDGIDPSEQRIDHVYCDMNGEAYRADEYGFTCLRTKEHFRSATDFVAPADCWGDIGAAGAPLHAILAMAACRRGYAKGPLSMVWASSESGERGACVLHAPVTPRE